MLIVFAEVIIMDNSVVFMFSGQGSQYYHMGKELFVKHPIFREWMLRLDKIVYEINGESVLEQLYNEQKQKNEKFDRTLYTHPAIFMVEYALTQVLLESGIEPDFVLGTSMGEFASAAVADIMGVKELLELLVKQAELFESHCHKGSMLAIIHDPMLYSSTPLIYENSELASVNYNSHFVISGEKSKVSIIEGFLKEKGIIYQELPVSYGFHSSLMEPAAAIYINCLNKYSYRNSQIPLASGLYGQILTKLPNNYFWNITRKPIQFPKAIRELENIENSIYLDLGPAGTLANFTKRNLEKDSESESYAIITPFNQELRNIETIKKLFSKQRVFKSQKKVKKMITFVFPGQGSQHNGMGGTLFDEFEKLTAKADEILGYSIKKLCLEDPNGQLSETQYTQPALYIVNALNYLKKVKDIGKTPDYVAGHSLGEYNALFAADAFYFETGLKMVIKRGELMSHATGGGMAAVIGLNEEQIADVLRQNNLQNIDIANYNTPSQIVISGLKTDIDFAKSIFEGIKDVKMFIPLKTSGAFHSRYMKEAKREFEVFLKMFEFSELSIPVISNVHARPYKQSDIKQNLIGQITHSVKWMNSIRYLMGLGEMEFIEIGPGKVLTGLIQQIKKEAEPLFIISDQIENTSKKGAQSMSIEAEIMTDSKSNKEESQLTEETIAKVTKASIEEKDKSRKDKIKQFQTVFCDILPTSLGSYEFKRDYKLKYAYLTGGMYHEIASTGMVVKMGKAGMMGFFGSGGLKISQIENAIQYIQKELSEGQAYGLNLINNPSEPEMEEKIVDLFLAYGVRTIEASAFFSITPALVKYRAKGLTRDQHGKVIALNRIIAKLSRPEVAEAFLSPVPERVLAKLLSENKITPEEADLSKNIPIADDICVEADSGGHTDAGVASVLMPAMIKLRDEMMEKYQYHKKVRVGAAGGIGTPAAASAAFILGADFILTGSINQCTVEAGTSNAVKDLLQQMNVQDTEYAPAGDMFELGARIQVLKKGLFFPARANKLHELYRRYNSLNEIDEKTKIQIQEKYFKKSFEEVYEDVKSFYPAQEIERAERNSKRKMALIFRWYFGYTTRLALSGSEESKVDYQVHCGPALGAFNQWVKGSDLENWNNRHVDEIGKKLMTETAELLNHRIKSIVS